LSSNRQDHAITSFVRANRDVIIIIISTSSSTADLSRLEGLESRAVLQLTFFCRPSIRICTRHYVAVTSWEAQTAALRLGF